MSVKPSVSLLHIVQAALCAVMVMISHTGYADQALKNVWKPDISIITEPANAEFVYIRNAEVGYFHIEHGAFEMGNIKPGWWSAQWKEEKDSDFIRFQNRWKSEIYLHVESGSLGAGEIKPGWLSARWKNSHAAMKDSGLKLRARFQCKDPGDDGCSNPLEDSISDQFKQVFKPACEVHDRCYASPWRLSGKTGYQGQKVCDDEFEDNMKTICRTSGTEFQFDCWVGKTAFYETVKDWGHKPFDDGQSKADNDCKDKNTQVKMEQSDFSTQVGM